MLSVTTQIMPAQQNGNNDIIMCNIIALQDKKKKSGLFVV
jgi:hypothetical protein